ncbi:putative membrane protein [Candidatus Methanomarinus sp.]|nr:putative membrane protein [ANME-2 cluster archaeon]
MFYKKLIPNDIGIIIFLVIITSIFVLVPPLSTTYVRTILGLPMVLFLPGYALIAALFPRKDDLDGIERLALSFGLSIAVVPLVGLGLNYTPWGIRLTPILITLDIFTLIMCVVAVKRRSVLPDRDVFTVPFMVFYQSVHNEIFSNHRSTIDKVLTVILVISIVVSIIMVVYVIITPKQGEKFTEFYLLGAGGMADDYPTWINTGESGTMIVGVVNHEYQGINYSMEVLLDNESIELPDQWKEISLKHNQTMERKLTLALYKEGEDMKLEFLLYKENNYTQPYRDLHLWVSVTEE